MAIKESGAIKFGLLRQDILQVAVPLIFFLIASVLMTWPLVINLQHSVAGDLGDNVQYVWLIGWFEEAIFKLHQSPFNASHLNYPEGWSPAYTEMPLSMVIPFLPVSLIAGPVAAYNLSIFISFVLSGIVVYFGVYRDTGNIIAALIAGSIFAYSPYRYSHHLAGHLNLLGTHWVALYVMLFLVCLRDHGRRLRYPLMTAVSLGLVALTSQYYTYMALLLSVVMLVIRLVWIRRWQPIDKDFWYRLGWFALPGLLLVFGALFPFFRLQSSGELSARSVEYVRQYSASPTDFMLPATTHFMLGEWVGTNFDRSYWIEATLYLGLFATVLAVLGVIRINTQSKFRSTIWLVMAFTFTAAVLALGTDLHWLSQSVWFKVPSFLRSFHPGEMARIPLPGRLLFEWLPYYDRMRVWMRYAAYVSLGVSILAGYGSAWISDKLQNRKKHAVMAALLALVLLDFLPEPQGFIDVDARPVDRWLAIQDAPGALVEFPFEKVADQAQLYYTLIHKKPFLGGSFNAFPPTQYKRIKPVLDKFPDEESVALLRELGVSYVLVHSDEYSDFSEVTRSILQQGLVFIRSFGEIQVYKLEVENNTP
jgi:hypothetical protein